LALSKLRSSDGMVRQAGSLVRALLVLELFAGLPAREPFLISGIILNAPACTEKIMRTWLEHDPVALAVLVVGIAAVELLALSF
jgi:hypothetical protein